MRWRVIRSGNPDAEREHLNKILAEMEAAVAELKAYLISNTGPPGPTGPTGPAGSGGGGGGSAEGSIFATFDADPAELEAGQVYAVFVPFDCTIEAVYCTGGFGESGSIEFDVSLATNQANIPTATSIVAAAPPTISAANASSDAVLTGWTTSVSAGNFIVFEVVSVAGFTQCSIALEVTKT